MSAGPLWTCPRCGRSFANRNQTHTCAALGDLDAHFAGKPPAIRATFDAFLRAPERNGVGGHGPSCPRNRASRCRRG